MSTDKKVTLSPSLLQLKFMQKGKVNAVSEPQTPTVHDDAWFVPASQLKLKPKSPEFEVEIIDSYYDVLDLNVDGWLLRRNIKDNTEASEAQELIESISLKRKQKKKDKNTKKRKHKNN